MQPKDLANIGHPFDVIKGNCFDLRFRKMKLETIITKQLLVLNLVLLFKIKVELGRDLLSQINGNHR